MIEVYNEEQCIKRSHELTVPHLIISITDPTAPLPEFSELAQVQRFCFMNLESSGSHYNGPMEYDAMQISGVIQKWGTLKPLLVHCAYGMSRSVAVGLAASLYWDTPVLFDRKRACPNRRLSRMLDEELKLGGRLVKEALKYNGF